MAKVDQLLPTVGEILFREWDPIGVNDNDACRNEYDSYARTIWRYLREGVGERQLASHLMRLQRDAMGMSQVDEALHQRVARRLCALLPKRA